MIYWFIAPALEKAFWNHSVRKKTMVIKPIFLKTGRVWGEREMHIYAMSLFLFGELVVFLLPLLSHGGWGQKEIKTSFSGSTVLFAAHPQG